jgi:hypothetical protein
LKGILRGLNNNTDYINRMSKPIEYKFYIRKTKKIMGELKIHNIAFTDYHWFTIIVYLCHIDECDSNDRLEMIYTHEWLHYLLLRDSPVRVFSDDINDAQDIVIREMMREKGEPSCLRF